MTSTHTPQWIKDWTPQPLEKSAKQRRAQRRAQRRRAHSLYIPSLPVPLWVKISVGIVSSNIAYNALYFNTCPSFDPITQTMATDHTILYRILDALRVASAVCGG